MEVKFRVREIQVFKYYSLKRQWPNGYLGVSNIYICTASAPIIVFRSQANKAQMCLK